MIIMCIDNAPAAPPNSSLPNSVSGTDGPAALAGLLDRCPIAAHSRRELLTPTTTRAPAPLVALGNGEDVRSVRVRARVREIAHAR